MSELSADLQKERDGYARCARVYLQTAATSAGDGDFVAAREFVRKADYAMEQADLIVDTGKSSLFRGAQEH